MRKSAIAQALASVPVNTDHIIMTGGLDQVTPPLIRKPGTCKNAQNFECDINGGYRRVKGYERFDGRPAPSDATYAILSATITGVPAVGNTLTGLTSAATGVIIALPGGSFVLTKVSGTFQNAEELQIGGSTVATATSLAITNGASTPLLHATYKNLAADKYRADIAAVPGSGDILGGFYYNDTCYAFRNNAGGTAAALYKETAGGWSLVAFEKKVAFTAGGGDIDEGDTLTQGGVTATVRRVVIRTGTLGGSSAAGILVITGLAGGNFAAGAATTTGAGTLTLSGAESTITLLPDGRFETVQENFGGTVNTKRVYGVDGVNSAWEFDGTYFVPIATGMSPDNPKHVKAHKKHLFLSFLGSVQHSSPGSPYVWSAVTGAAEIGMGDEVTGFGSSPGSEAGAALPIFTRNRLSILYGSTVSDWNLVPYKDEIGAYHYSVQDVGFTMFLDDQGLTDIQTSQAYGNFAHNAISNQIRPLLTLYRPSATASAVSRDLSQYRIFFSNQFGFYVTLVGRKVIGIMPVFFPHVVRCTWSAEDSEGREVIFFGGDDGYVFQMEKGTSFDGEEIEFFFELAYNFQKSPRVEKQYRDAMLEVSGSGYAAFNFGFELGYAATDIPAASQIALETSFSSVYWDSFVWDAFFWDGVTLTPNVVDCTGTAENIALAIRGSSDIYEQFTVTGALINYSPRRRLRP